MIKGNGLNSGRKNDPSVGQKAREIEQRLGGNDWLNPKRKAFKTKMGPETTSYGFTNTTLARNGLTHPKTRGGQTLC